MKLNSILITCVLIALCSCSQTGVRRSQFRPSESFTEFIGLDVLNLQNEKLGIVKYITADLENARLVEVIVISGDSGKTTAIPPRALTLDAASRAMRLNMSKAKFEAAPAFNTSDFAASSQRGPVARVNRYFGLEPWFFTEGQAVRENAQILRLGYVQTTDQLHGLTIQNTRGEHIGTVGALRMDLPKGQIVHVVVKTGAMASSSSVIQPRALKFNAAKNGLILDSTMSELAGEPHLRWLDGGKTRYQEEQYVNLEVKADKGLHSEQNAQAGKVQSAIPMEEGESFRDNQKTARINQAIQSDPTLSATAKNVEVVTHNAQTTLRGHVRTAADKARIGSIAMKAGRTENVSNLLEVRP